jgi:hypothetical protein
VQPLAQRVGAGAVVGQVDLGAGPQPRDVLGGVGRRGGQHQGGVRAAQEPGVGQGSARQQRDGQLALVQAGGFQPAGDQQHQLALVDGHLVVFAGLHDLDDEPFDPPPVCGGAHQPQPRGARVAELVFVVELPGEHGAQEQGVQRVEFVEPVRAVVVVLGHAQRAVA